MEKQKGLKSKDKRDLNSFSAQGAGHNDVELYNQYLDRLKKFLSVELVN